MWWGWRVPWWMSYFHLVAVHVINSSAYVWPLPLTRHIFLFWDIQGRSVHYNQGGRGRRERRNSDQLAEIGRLMDLHTGQGKMMSKLYKVNKRSHFKAWGVMLFRIRSIFQNCFLHRKSCKAWLFAVENIWTWTSYLIKGKLELCCLV